MASITSAGIGSGIDIEGLISKLISAEGAPVTTRLNKQEAGLQADLSAYGNLKSALSTFQTSVQSLKDTSSFQPRTATSSNVDLFTVSATQSAVPSSYSIKVEQLAGAAKIRSGDFASDGSKAGAGTLAISLGSTSFNITVGADSTLANIRDSINQATDNPGISASLIKVDSGTQLILTSGKVGAANTITISATDSDANDGNDLTRLATTNFTTVQAPQDSIIYVDQQKVTRNSNSLTDVINGVTLTLNKADVNTTGTVTVDLDKSTVKSNVNGFVQAYNALADTISNLSSYDQSTKTAGPLFGDAATRGIKNQLRLILSSPVQGASTFSTLAELGITTNKAGDLVVDSAKLDTAISSDFSSVSKLFSSTDGVAKRFDTALTNYLSSSGSLSSSIDGVNTVIKGIGDQRTRLSAKLTADETRYRKQFTAMDTLVSQLQATSSFLTQQLSGLSSSGK